MAQLSPDDNRGFWLISARLRTSNWIVTSWLNLFFLLALYDIWRTAAWNMPSESNLEPAKWCLFSTSDINHVSIILFLFFFILYTDCLNWTQHHRGMQWKCRNSIIFCINAGLLFFFVFHFDMHFVVNDWLILLSIFRANY